MFTESCTIERRGAQVGEDVYGEPIFAPATSANAPCWWEPMSTIEDIAAAEQYTLMITIYLPISFEAAIDGSDAVLVRGRRYEVKGRPQIQPSGFAVDGYVKVLLQEVTG